MSKNVKIRIVYKTTILPVVLYGCETFLLRNMTGSACEQGVEEGGREGREEGRKAKTQVGG
jgi:hypothetical protein